MKLEILRLASKLKENNKEKEKSNNKHNKYDKHTFHKEKGSNAIEEYFNKFEVGLELQRVDKKA